MSDIAQHIRFLRGAELQFRLASAVRLAATFKSQPRDLPMEWTHGDKCADEVLALKKQGLGIRSISPQLGIGGVERSLDCGWDEGEAVVSEPS